MPFYEYECRECGEKFTALLSMSRRDELEPTLACPRCEAKGPRRLLSSFATGGSGSGGAPAPSCGGGG
ncbi:MAG: FmdB family zinc ribbon protein [Candidatus Krumholzibacteriia bacterium]|nr:zinc ribbon domain-containing protein [bacterium]MCB9514179.1 zinc ribbon domain-containing protein [Candidatus Latescibacterota bacterium]MCB9515838.1 zinc ribbon domain-containing protein [Candidatus Latescibacterota bacterium]